MRTMRRCWAGVMPRLSLADPIASVACDSSFSILAWSCPTSALSVASCAEGGAGEVEPAGAVGVPAVVEVDMLS